MIQCGSKLTDTSYCPNMQRSLHNYTDLRINAQYTTNATAVPLNQESV